MRKEGVDGEGGDRGEGSGSREEVEKRIKEVLEKV